MANTDHFVERLLDFGLSQEVVNAALPDWWAPEDGQSNSAKTLASLLLARRLSLDPRALLDDDVPLGFLHSGPIKFKHMRLADGRRKEALVAFAQGVARITLRAMAEAAAQPVPENPLALRHLLLGRERPFVSFGDVLTACWSLGIPVLHLRVFPSTTKGVTAIAIRQGNRHAILVARETGVDAQYMFHVAHELGHIALGHLRDTAAIVDADPHDPANKPEELIDDDEERAADEYAQKLLTGNGTFSVVRDAIRSSSEGNARELAKRATEASGPLKIDPGHIVMCFGHSTGDWGLAMAAAKLLPQQPGSPGGMVNRVLWGQLAGLTNEADDRARAFLQAVAPV